MATNKLTSRLFEPTISVLAPIPAIAWVPLLIMCVHWRNVESISDCSWYVFVVSTHVIVGIRATRVIWWNLPRYSAKAVGTAFVSCCSFCVARNIRRHAGGDGLVVDASSGVRDHRLIGRAGLAHLDARNFSRPDDLFVGMICVGIMGRLSDMALLAVEGLRHAGAQHMLIGKAMPDELIVAVDEK